MKRLISLLALPISVLLTSTSQSNGSVVLVTGLELEYNKSENKITILTRLTIDQDYKDIDCFFIWNLIKDGEEIPVDEAHTIGFKKRENTYMETQPIIDVNTLGKKNSVSVDLYPKDNKYKLIRYEAFFDLKGNVKVNFKESDNNVGVSSGFYIDNYSPLDPEKDAIREDRITFTNFEDIVVEEKYLNFDISRFEFNYTGNKDKSYLDGEFYFGIYDKYNILTNLPLFEDSLYRYIPLKIASKDNGNNCFIFENKIYYDPVTHNPSLYYKENYVETNKLYFPLNEVERLKTNQCMLFMNINGYTKFSMSGSFDIHFIRKYFGECTDSEYCVESNYDEGDNIRETVIDVNL